MSMRLAVNCPFCKRPMATSAAFAGQMIACPNCRGEFVLNSPGLTPPVPAGVATAPPGLALERQESSTVAVAAAAIVAPPPPQPISRLHEPASPPALSAALATTAPQPTN